MLFVFSLIQQVLNWGYSLKQGLTVFESLAWFLKSFQGTTLSKECLLFYNGCNRTRIYCGIMCRQSGHFATCSSSRTHSCSNALLRPWFNPTPPLPVHWVVKDSPKNHISILPIPIFHNPTHNQQWAIVAKGVFASGNLFFEAEFS